MNLPLINILIRNKYRPELLRRCIQSVKEQEYSNVRIIIISDSAEGLKDAAEVLVQLYKETGINTLFLSIKQDSAEKHFWNLYCNQLKEKVEEGWFFFLDNDDHLRSGVLKELAVHLKDPATGIICQFLRNGRAKPNDQLIKQRKILKGLIGGGCIVLHHSHKHVAEWDGEAAADYRYIKAVSENVPLKFIPLVVQVAGNNGLHGK